MRMVAVLALESVVGFELTVPGQVFGAANRVTAHPHYEVRVAAPGRRVSTDPGLGAMSVHTPWDLDSLAEADTIVIPGRADFLTPVPADLLDALRTAAARGARIASVCVGAFTLAATGLLDGMRATTHWQYAAELARRHPLVEVDPAVLFVDNDTVLTSAGIAAGLDLCLHLVRRDLGAAVAADTARHVVMPPQREGGQAQFIVHADPEGPGTPLHQTLEWLQANLHRPLTLADIAAHTATSVRSLNRHFQAQIGTTPLRWLLRARVQHAQRLLETTDLPIDRVAHQAGFGAATTLRHHFTRLTGTSPQAYRASFSATRGAVTTG